MPKSKRGSTRKSKKSSPTIVSKKPATQQLVTSRSALAPVYKTGYSPAVWSAAKSEAKQEMIAAAVAQGVMNYTQLVERITSISLQADDLRLAFLLDEISREENLAGRGMLTAVVVRKSNGQPGKGFFRLAKQLGRNTSCEATFWIEELKMVHKSWKRDVVGHCALLPVSMTASIEIDGLPTVP